MSFLFKKRKKSCKLIVVMLLSLTLLCFLGQPFIKVKASDLNNASKEELGEIIQEQINELDLAALQEYLDSIALSDKNAADYLMEFVKGEKVDYSQIGREILRILTIKIEELLPIFITIIAITLLSSLITSLHSISVGNTSVETISIISFTAVLLPVLSVLIKCIATVENCILSMQKQMQIIFPLMLTLLAASGGTVSAAIAQPAVGFFSMTIASMITSVVLPLTIVIIAFSIIGNLSKELKIGKFTQFFKSVNKWVLGLSVSIFGLFYTMQGITAASYDGIVRRAAKYAIGNGIPIIGGFLSGGFDLAIAGSVLIKNSLGSMGVFLMIFIIFEPLILLISLNLLLRFTAAITQPFEDSRISNFLGETADNLHYCTASILFIAFLYFLSVLLIVCSSEAII